MARHETTGEVRQNADGSFSALVRTWEKRETFRLPTCTTEPEAEARSKLLADVAKRFRLAQVNQAQGNVALEILAGASARSLPDAVRAAEELLGGEIPRPGASKPTFGAIGQKWTSGALHREHPDHVRNKKYSADAARLAVFCEIDVGGVKLGDVPIDRVTLDHAESAMRQLPERARKPTTRRHYAQTFHRVLALAVYPLRLIPANPLPRGFMPRTGKPPAFSYLYPAEDAALMRCEAIPLGERVLFGLLSREGLRAGEALSLRPTSLDLNLGTITLDETKTDDARAWALDPGVVRALRAYVARSGANSRPGAPVFLDADGEPYESNALARPLRNALRKANIHRPELFDTTEVRRRFRAHDLRGTFVTLSLANGQTETWVADRTGHTSSQMINRYRRAARSAMELGLGPLLPLDFAIPELSPIPGMVAGLRAVSLPLDCHSGGSGGGQEDPQVAEKKDLGEVTEWSKVHDWKGEEPIHDAAENSRAAEKTPPAEVTERTWTDLDGSEWQSSGNSGGRTLLPPVADGAPDVDDLAKLAARADALHALLRQGLAAEALPLAAALKDALGAILEERRGTARVLDLGERRRRR